MTRLWMQRASKAGLFLFWAAVVAAPFVAHAAITTGRFTHVAIGFAAAQVAALTVMAWRASGVLRVAGLILSVLLLGLLGLRVLYPAASVSAILATSGVSHAVIYSSLLVLFGQSLRPGRIAFVTTLAARMRDTMTPAMVRYTRGVTVAWCCFFIGQLLLSATLLAWAPRPVWSLMVNVLDGPMLVLMFAGEYALRRWRFRNVPHVSPLAAVRGYASRTGPGD